MSAAKKLEVHEHWIIAGPNANKSWLNKFEHSHEGGDVPHKHDDGIHETGPAARTIDKDEWFAATGLRGGGRKKFTAKPTGPQMPLVRTEPCKIEVIIVGDGGASVAGDCSGAGDLPIVRMKKAFGAVVTSVTHVAPPRRRAAR